jgi:hypothetical protein
MGGGGGTLEINLLIGFVQRGVGGVVLSILPEYSILRYPPLGGSCQLSEPCNCQPWWWCAAHTAEQLKRKRDGSGSAVVWGGIVGWTTEYHVLYNVKVVWSEQRWVVRKKVPQIANLHICGFFRFADLPQKWRFADLQFEDQLFFANPYIHKFYPCKYKHECSLSNLRTT